MATAIDTSMEIESELQPRPKSNNITPKKSSSNMSSSSTATYPTTNTNTTNTQPKATKPRNNGRTTNQPKQYTQNTTTTTRSKSTTIKKANEEFKNQLVHDVFGRDNKGRVPMEKVAMLIWQFRDDPAVVQFMAQFVAKVSYSDICIVERLYIRNRCDFFWG